MKGRNSKHTFTRGAAWVVSCALGLALASCQPGGSKSAADLPMRAIGPYRIGARNAPDPPRTGENTLTIVVRDASGAPVKGATVTAVIVMPAMGAMPRMESRGGVVESRPGEYRARYGLGMNGEWDLAIEVAAAGAEPVRADYRLSTSVAGLAFDESGSEPAAGAATGQAAHSGHAGHGDGGSEPLGIVTLDASRRQSLGVRTEPVSVRELSARIRAAGHVTFDESRQTQVTLKFGGYVREVAVAAVGQPVRRGQTLFTAYSPELWSAQRELIEALGKDGADSASAMAHAARKRLELWDVPAGEIDAIVRTRTPRETLPIVAHVSGVVTEKNVMAGGSFMPGQVLYALAPLDPVWVLANVYPMDLPLVRAGMHARLRNASLAGGERMGRVAFVYPSIAGDTRSGQVRIDVANPSGDLKPGAYVDVELDTPIGNRLAVPESAVLPTGEQRIVFVDLGEGRLAPRAVKLGQRAGDYFEVLDGLAPGDMVVTSGNFLVAAESRLRAPASGR